MSTVEVFRPRSSYLLFAAVVFFSGGLWLASVDPADLIATAGGLLALVGTWSIGYLVFVRPKVELSPTGIRIVNLMSEVTIGWQDVRSIDTRYSLAVRTDDRLVYAVAAPAPGRYHARTVHQAELRGLDLPSTDQLRPGDSPRAHSGVAAQIARRYWREYQAAQPAVSQPTVGRSRTGLPIAALLQLTFAFAIAHFHA